MRVSVTEIGALRQGWICGIARGYSKAWGFFGHVKFEMSPGHADGDAKEVLDGEIRGSGEKLGLDV